MADINITQEEAEILLAMEKHRVNEERSDFPMRGQSLTCRYSPRTSGSSFCLI
jgi:hypothetical protein